jgi:small subunit ribosomal protein S19
MAKKKRTGRAKAARRRIRKKRGVIEARRKKEFTYRGHTLEEIHAMTLEEFRELLPARARRTLARGFNEEQQAFLNRVRKTAKEDVVRTHRREMVIIPEMIGRTLAVHDGREFRRVEVKPEMLGHYLGEFALTRTTVRHSGPGVGATRSSKYMPLK